MNKVSFLNEVSGRKGQNRKATITRQMKTLKRFEGLNLIKKTSLVIRTGIDYDNQQVVKEMRENGELPAENQGLPWGEWDVFPYTISHKGKDYARLYPASGLEFVPSVQFFLDGVEVDKDGIREFCLASEFPKEKEKPLLCMTVGIENLEM